VERRDCTAAAVEHYLAGLDSRPVVAVYGMRPAEPIGSVVVEQLLRNHMALVVAEGVGPVVVQGTHAGPVVLTGQLWVPRSSRKEGPTCCPPGIAPYVPGLYPLAACCCGWLHCCWFGVWVCAGGAHWLWACGVADWYPMNIVLDARTHISGCNPRAPTPICVRWGSCVLLLPSARLLIARRLPVVLHVGLDIRPSLVASYVRCTCRLAAWVVRLVVCISARMGA
jgi:hypothetical protein